MSYGHRPDEKQIMFWTVAVCLIALVFLIAGIKRANSHNSWVNSGAYKNPQGEWCCGDHDCKSYDKAAASARGWIVDGELIPYSENIQRGGMDVVPPDGKLTICRRPDGTRRCVFGLKPGI